jgi:hypothetical protein
LSQKKKRREYPFVLFLEDAFGSGDHPDALRDAGFDVRCFREDFPAKPGKPEQSVKDPRIILHCDKYKYVLITTDKQLCYTHIDTVKKTDIVVIATESNRDNISVWVKALIKGKANIDRLVKKTEKNGVRPCCARISRTGAIRIDENYKARTTKKKRPREGQE